MMPYSAELFISFLMNVFIIYNVSGANALDVSDASAEAQSA